MKTSRLMLLSALLLVGGLAGNIAGTAHAQVSADIHIGPSVRLRWISAALRQPRLLRQLDRAPELRLGVDTRWVRFELAALSVRPLGVVRPGVDLGHRRALRLGDLSLRPLEYDDPEIGWSWVPGNEWAPSWVSFQEGSDYIGWAPLPPSVNINVGFNGLVDVSIAPEDYVFVQERYFLAPRLNTYFVPRERVVNIYHETRNLSNYRYSGDRVYNNGVSVDRIQQVVGRPVPRYRIADSRTRGAARPRGSRNCRSSGRRSRGPPTSSPLPRVRRPEGGGERGAVPAEPSRSRRRPPGRGAGSGATGGPDGGAAQAGPSGKGEPGAASSSRPSPARRRLLPLASARRPRSRPFRQSGSAQPQTYPRPGRGTACQQPPTEQRRPPPRSASAPSRNRSASSGPTRTIRPRSADEAAAASAAGAPAGSPAAATPTGASAAAAATAPAGEGKAAAG